MASVRALAGLAAGTGGDVGITADRRESVPVAVLGQPGVWAVFRYGLAPAGLATRRQLSAAGLRPGGHPPVAELSWRQGRRWAALYLVSRAAPKRPVTAAKRAALAKANRARRTCPDCGRDAGYVIPPTLGVCAECHYGPADMEDAA